MSKQLPGNYPCSACNSSDAKRIYEDGTTFCFSCQTFGRTEGGETPVATKPSMDFFKKVVGIEEIREYPTRGFEERGIEKSVCEFFGVKVSYNADGKIDTHYYPYGDDAYKVRKLPKEFTWVHKSTALFGMDKFNGGGKRVIITEGEIDALSIAQANWEKYKKVYPVVAMSSAVMTKSLIEAREWLRSFTEVVLCLDNDEAGQKATTEAIRIIGVDKVKIAKLPHKDPNEVLLKNGWKALMTCVYDAARYIPAGIISKEGIWKQIQERKKIPSVPYPACLTGVNEKIKGRRLGEITLFISGTGCLGYDTDILMYDGSLKKVQDIDIGDLVMGPDNIAREVKNLFRGEEQMYRVSIRGGESFICNESHILSVVNIDNEGRWGLRQGEIVDVSVKDYLTWSAKRKHLSKAFKTGPLDFDKQQLPLHPYAMGVWLGDGYSAGSRISSNDIEIPAKLVSLGYDVEKQATEFAWSFRGVQPILHSLNLVNNKHIPDIYLKGSYEDRLELFAGLIDTDGSYSSATNGYEFSQKSELMTDQFIRLANSLGFQATKGKQVNNKFGNCFRVWVNGEGLEHIPVALDRKKARPRKQMKDALRFKMEIERLDVDHFYGFQVDSDGRFVLGNFIVTHNSGKSTVVREIIIDSIHTTDHQIGVISLEESPGETGEKLAGMEIKRNPAEEDISEEDLKVGFDVIFGDDRVTVLDHQGSIKDDSIVDQIEYMCLIGCKEILIDHITILVSEGADGLTGNEAIDKIMNDLLRIAKRHNVWIGLVSHLRKVQVGGKSFEEGKLPSMDDIRGSGSIKQVSMDIIAFSRDMGADDETVRNTIKIAVLKSRTMGKTGKVPGCIYDSQTGRLAYVADVPTVEEHFTRL